MTEKQPADAGSGAQPVSKPRPGATAEAFLTTARQSGDLGGFGGSAARFVLRLHEFLGARGYLT